MSSNHLLIDCPTQRVRPGDRIQGEILWDLDGDPTCLTLALGWWTVGKGEQDEELVAVEKWETQSRIGREEFAFVLPDGPTSFTGRLISLKWGLELAAVGPWTNARHHLTLGPSGNPVSIAGQSYESLNASLPFRIG